MDCRKEIMSANEDSSSCESLSSVGNSKAMAEDNEQHWNRLQHVNLLLEDHTSSETSWTNEKHSLYLNSIEDAFVSSLYQQGYYKHPRQRLQPDQGEISSVLRLDLNEEAESGFSEGNFLSEESQSESDVPMIHRHTLNHSKGCRLNKLGGINSKMLESVRDEKSNKRKVQSEVADPGRENREEKLQCSHNDESASNFCGLDRLTQNTSITGISKNQDDQVVPSIDDKSDKEDGKPR